MTTLKLNNVSQPRNIKNSHRISEILWEFALNNVPLQTTEVYASGITPEIHFTELTIKAIS